MGAFDGDGVDPPATSKNIEAATPAPPKPGVLAFLSRDALQMGHGITGWHTRENERLLGMVNPDILYGVGSVASVAVREVTAAARS